MTDTDTMPTIRDYNLGDRVRIRGASSFAGTVGRIAGLRFTYGDHRTADYVTALVELPGFPPLPFAPSELDLAEVSDRMLDTLAADWRLPRAADELDADECEAIGLDPSGRCLGTQYPWRESELFPAELDRLRRYRDEEEARAGERQDRRNAFR